MAKVLYVDDEESLRESIIAHLEECGFEVLGAEDGSKALEIVKANDDIATIITDLRMPVMNGIELVKELRSRGFQGKTGVVTAEVIGQLKNELTELNIAVLSKPFDMPKLINFIESL